MRGRRRGGGGGGNDSSQRFVMEFLGLPGCEDVVRLACLAWSWGMSSSGPSGGRRRRGWGAEDDDEEQEKQEEEKEEIMSLNTQDISCTCYMERNLVRGPMNTIAKGKMFKKWRLVGYSADYVVPRKEGETRSEKELIAAGDLVVSPYFIVETCGKCYVSSVSTGGSGGESALTVNITVSSDAGYDFHYYNSEGRDAQVNDVDEWAGALLGASISTNRPKANAATVTTGEQPLVIEFGVVHWTPATHYAWPESFRLAVKTTLLCLNRLRVGGSFPVLSRDCLVLVFQWLSRSFVPSIGERYRNPNPFESLQYGPKKRSGK